MRKSKRIAYPALEAWMNDNELSIGHLATMVCVTYATMYNLLTDNKSPGKFTIDAVLRVTGMTYEQAFTKKEGLTISHIAKPKDKNEPGLLYHTRPDIVKEHGHDRC